MGYGECEATQIPGHFGKQSPETRSTHAPQVPGEASGPADPASGLFRLPGSSRPSAPAPRQAGRSFPPSGACGRGRRPPRERGQTGRRSPGQTDGGAPGLSLGPQQRRQHTPRITGFYSWKQEVLWDVVRPRLGRLVGQERPVLARPGGSQCPGASTRPPGSRPWTPGTLTTKGRLPFSSRQHLWGPWGVLQESFRHLGPFP